MMSKPCERRKVAASSSARCPLCCRAVNAAVTSLRPGGCQRPKLPVVHLRPGDLAVHAPLGIETQSSGQALDVEARPGPAPAQRLCHAERIEAEGEEPPAVRAVARPRL